MSSESRKPPRTVGGYQVNPRVLSASAPSRSRRGRRDRNGGGDDAPPPTVPKDSMEQVVCPWAVLSWWADRLARLMLVKFSRLTGILSSLMIIYIQRTRNKFYEN